MNRTSKVLTVAALAAGAVSVGPSASRAIAINHDKGDARAYEPSLRQGTPGRGPRSQAKRRKIARRRGLCS